jgi:Tol biopolymer transport system component
MMCSSATWQQDARPGVSVASDGTEGRFFSGDHTFPQTQSVISADGHTVAFASHMSNLVPHIGARDRILIHDLRDGSTTAVPAGRRKGPSAFPSISGDGTRIAYVNYRWPNAPHYYLDAFIYDQVTGPITPLATTPAGRSTNGYTSLPVISADGQSVAFTSNVSTLAAGDTNNRFDVFLTRLAPGGQQIWCYGTRPAGYRAAAARCASVSVAGSTRRIISHR